MTLAMSTVSSRAKPAEEKKKKALKKRLLPEVIEELERKVLEAACQVQPQM